MGSGATDISLFHQEVFLAGLQEGSDYPSIGILRRDDVGYYSSSSTTEYGNFRDSLHIKMDLTFQDKYGGLYEPVFIVECDYKAIVTILQR